MSFEREDKPFMDSRTIIAIVLVGLVWFAWQAYLNNKYPKAPPVAESATTTPNATPSTTTSAVETNGAPTSTSMSVAAATQINNTLGEKIDLSAYSAEVKTVGMAMSSIVLKKYFDRDGTNMKIGSDFGFFQTQDLNGLPIEFQISKISSSEFVGRSLRDGVEISKTIRFREDGSAFDVEILVKDPNKKFTGLKEVFKDQIYDFPAPSLFNPSTEHQDLFVQHQKTEVLPLSGVTENQKFDFNNTKLLGIGTRYFVAGMVDHSSVYPRFSAQTDVATKKVQAEMLYQPTNANTEFSFKYTGYIGPKSLLLLEKIDPAMKSFVNLGFFATIAEYLMKTMMWFHNWIPNWGMAIILLTLLVRILVLPFNITSYKSMKKMQLIQPRIKDLRERYKDDPTTLNREMMNLMRTEKVNPLGGCLPMLLQMPIFFALYQAIGQSIELYQAPFFGWIKDLSLKDPFYVLPILMSVAMFVQQKITPTNMDPTQAKIMQWMPVIFGLMMITLPSGLTLYIFISTLFGIVQQKIFLSDRKSETA